MRSASCLLAILAVGAVTSPAEAFAKAKDKELRRRTITLSDNTSAVPEIHVGSPYPTTLMFQAPIRKDGVLLVDARHFEEPHLMDNWVLLRPKAGMPKDYSVALTVTMKDGTVVPFKLVNSATDVDLQVDLIVKLQSPDSPQALKMQISQLQGELDECQGNGTSAALEKLAALIREQNLDKPQAFERHAIHTVDKQSRLLVAAQAAYRLFGYTLLVLTVENRDPGKEWMLEKPEVKVVGSSEYDVKVLAFSSDVVSLAPGASEKVVVAFATPEAKDAGQRVDVALLEKEGKRHVHLEKVDL